MDMIMFTILLFGLLMLTIINMFDSVNLIQHWLAFIMIMSIIIVSL